jgi:hypothetical protein
LNPDSVSCGRHQTLFVGQNQQLYKRQCQRRATTLAASAATSSPAAIPSAGRPEPLLPHPVPGTCSRPPVGGKAGRGIAPSRLLILRACRVPRCGRPQSPGSDSPDEWSTAGARSRTSCVPPSSKRDLPESRPRIRNPGSTWLHPESGCGVRHDGSGDGKRWRCPPGELHTALADHRVVLLRHLLRELRHVSDLTRSQDLLFRRIRTREGNVLANAPSNRNVSCNTTPSCVRNVSRRTAARSLPSTRTSLGRIVERRHQSDDRGLPRARRSHQRGHRPGRDSNVTSCSTGLPSL